MHPGRLVCVLVRVLGSWSACLAVDAGAWSGCLSVTAEAWSGRFPCNEILPKSTGILLKCIQDAWSASLSVSWAPGLRPWPWTRTPGLGACPLPRTPGLGAFPAVKSSQKGMESCQKAPRTPGLRACPCPALLVCVLGCGCGRLVWVLVRYRGRLVCVLSLH